MPDDKIPNTPENIRAALEDSKKKKEDEIEAAFIRGQRSIATRMLSQCFSALEGEDIDRAALLKILEETRMQAGFLARDIGAREYHPKLHPGDVISSIIAPKLKELGVMDRKDDRPIWRPAPERCDHPGFYWVDKGERQATLNNPPSEDPRPDLKFFDIGQSFTCLGELEGQHVAKLHRQTHRYYRVAGPVSVVGPRDA